MSPNIRTILREGAAPPTTTPDLDAAMARGRRWKLRRRTAFATGTLLVLFAAVTVVPSLWERRDAALPPGSGPAGRDERPAVGTGTGKTSKRIGGELAQVRMIVTPARVPEGQQPSMILQNLGEIDLSHGLDFRVEVRTPSGWHWVNRDQAFRSPLLHLPAGSSTDPSEIGVYFDSPDPVPLAPGVYRVSTYLQTDAVEVTAPSLAVAARFEVVRQSESGPTSALDEDEGFVPYPGSQWHGRDGEPIPLEDQLINVISGPEHCEWESAAMLHVTWPPGARAGGEFTEDLQYIRDPDNVIGNRRMFERFEGETSLPDGSRYTGYRTDFMELWVPTYEEDSPVVTTAGPPSNIYLVFEDHIESWPLARDRIACG